MRRLDAVAEDAHVREEVELLEEHPGAEPHLPDLLLVRPAARVQGVGVQAQAVDLDRSDSRLLEEVDAAQQGRLPRSGSADDHDRLAAPNLEVHAAQDVVRAEVLLDAADADDDLADVPRQRLLVSGARGGRSLAVVRDAGRLGHRSPRAIRRSSRSWNVLNTMVMAQ